MGWLAARGLTEAGSRAFLHGSPPVAKKNTELEKPHAVIGRTRSPPPNVVGQGRFQPITKLEGSFLNMAFGNVLVLVSLRIILAREIGWIPSFLFGSFLALKIAQIGIQLIFGKPLVFT